MRIDLAHGRVDLQRPREPSALLVLTHGAGGAVETADVGGDVERGERHRQHPSRRTEQLAHPVQGGDRVPELLPEPDDQQVADHVPAHLALAGEPVLQHPGPGVAPLVLAAERRERHPQVPRRQDAEL